MEAHLRDIVCPAHFIDRLAAIGFPQYADLVLCCVAFAFHGLGLFQFPRLTLLPAQKSAVTSSPPPITYHRSHVIYPLSPITYRLISTMAFNPLLPLDGSLIEAPEMRSQLNGLKTLIDNVPAGPPGPQGNPCLLYTSDAADK